MKVVLHIGLPKTATTLTQRVLSDPSNKGFLAKNGINYSRQPLVTHQLSDEEIKRRFQEELIPEKINLYSCESMLPFDWLGEVWQEEELQQRGDGAFPIFNFYYNRLIGILRTLDCDISIIVTWREQVSFVESMYGQAFKEGRSERSSLTDYINYDNMDYKLLFEVISNELSDRDSLHMLWYEDIINHGEVNFIQLFLSIFSSASAADLFVSQDKYIRNTGPVTSVDFDMLRKFKNDTGKRKQMRKLIQERKIFSYYKNIIDPSTKAQIQNKYKESNQRLGMPIITENEFYL